jgi:hypothetical protein
LKSKKGYKGDRFATFAYKIKKFCGTLQTLDLAEPHEVDTVYKTEPRDLFARFFMRRIEKVTNDKTDG